MIRLVVIDPGENGCQPTSIAFPSSVNRSNPSAAPLDDHTKTHEEKPPPRSLLDEMGVSAAIV
jgi:hypothetical protein